MANPSSPVLVVLDSGYTVRSGPPEPPAYDGTAILLSFSQPGSILDEVRAGLEATGASVDVESGVPAVDDVALHVTDRYLDLLARVPSEFTVDGKSLKRAWAYEEGLSLWWLHELSGRRSDIYSTFTRLCQIEVTKRVLARTGATRLVLLTNDAAFASVARSLCDAVHVGYSEPPDAPERQSQPDALGFAGLVARLSLWAVRVIAMTAMAKLLTRNTQPAHGAGPVCCFTTLYPSMFRGTQGATDDKFLAVPTLIAEQGIRPFIGVTFAADDGHQHLSLGANVKACLMLRRQQAFNGIPARLADRDLSWWHLFAGIRTGLHASFTQYRIARKRSFRERWNLDGVDIFPLIVPELQMAAYRTPRYLVHMLRMRDFFNRVRPDAVAGALFEFIIGRAVTYAAHTSSAPPLTIGVQHGPSGRKLMYQFLASEFPETLGHDTPDRVPLPMHLVVEADETLRTMMYSGYTGDRVHDAGAPRLDALAGVPRFSSLNTDAKRPFRVLVVFGGSDGAQIMGLCKPVIERASEYHFVMKPHPRSRVQAPQIYEQLRGVSGATYEVATEGYYDLLPTADVVVVTYSSAGMEAASLGYPVVALNMPDYASPSGLMDAGGNVRFAGSPEALIAALKAATRAVPQGDPAPAQAFWNLDGRAQERWAETIARLVKQYVLG